MRRILFGSALLAHGLLHSALGTWSAGYGQPWVSTPLWLAAQLGFMIGGLGVLGVPWCRRVWLPAALLGALSSLLMFALYAQEMLLPGIAADLLVLLFGMRWREPTLLTKGSVPPMIADPVEAQPIRHRRARRAASIVATALVVWTGVVIAGRPFYLDWGTDPDARVVRLPGDDLVPAATYRSDRAVMVRAPADSVWPWLVQIGQDRAGFYSYDRLERMIGARIHNADRIHTEWQVIQAGQLVRATQPDYLGGRFGRDPGWRVAEVVPGRAIVLEGWGAFVLRPVDSTTTVLHVRTRGDGTPTVRSTMLSPFGLLLSEPVHFMMERRMLLGIRDRAESS